MRIQCCYKCDRPWKSPTCHCYCPVYIAQAEQNEKDRAEKWEKSKLDQGLYEQYARSIEKAYGRNGLNKKLG